MLFITGCSNLIVLEPKGSIGQEEVNLIGIAFILMLTVVIPVLILTFLFAMKYRASKSKNKYKPNWTGSASIEWIIWSVPIGIIIVLSYLTWVKTHQLDPYKPLESKNEPVRIEVISLDWRWLFIYPDYDIATTNHLVFPVDTPLEFRLTSSSVMTSFFIPQLGSQMYAMAGMQTKLNLIANEKGTFTGQNQEFSGHGYETMFFKAKSLSENEFIQWVKEVRKEGVPLDNKTFNALIQPTDDETIHYYTKISPNIFDNLIKKFRNGNIETRASMNIDTTENKNIDTDKTNSN